MKLVTVFLLALVAAVFVSCSEKICDPSDPSTWENCPSGGGSSDRGGTLSKFCGYQFEQESDNAKLQTEKALLGKRWIIPTGNTCTGARDESGKEYCYKGGWQFDLTANKFGQIYYHWNNATEIFDRKAPFEITSPRYASIKISPQLSGKFEKYRVAQLETALRGFSDCQTFAYRFQANRLKLVGGARVHGVSTQRPPTLQDFLNQFADPESDEKTFKSYE